MKGICELTIMTPNSQNNHNQEIQKIVNEAKNKDESNLHEILIGLDSKMSSLIIKFEKLESKIEELDRKVTLLTKIELNDSDKEALRSIQEYIQQFNQGITIKQFAEIRNLNYAFASVQIKRLVNNKLLFGRRGTLVDLKPENSVFYYPIERFSIVFNPEFMTSLEFLERELLSVILRHPRGCSERELLEVFKTSNSEKIKEILTKLLRLGVIDIETKTNPKETVHRYFNPALESTNED